MTQSLKRSFCSMITAWRVPQMSQTPTTPLPNSAGRSIILSSSRIVGSSDRLPRTSPVRFLTIAAVQSAQWLGGGRSRRPDGSILPWTARGSQLEAMTVPGGEHGEAERSEAFLERAVCSHHDRAFAHRGFDHAGVAVRARGNARKLLGE